MCMDTKIIANSIHLWYCNFDENLKNLPYYTTLLSEDEVARSLRFKFKKDRQSYVISRGVLRVLLGKYTHEKPEQLEFAYGKQGKPGLNSPIKFNISHSGNMAVFGFTINDEIGVDIEYIKPDVEVMHLAENFFSETEIAMLKSLPEAIQKRAFYRCWTRKEAFIKAEGSGLSFPLDQFSVSVDDDTVAKLLETKWNTNQKNNWALHSCVPKADYIAAVAVENSLSTHLKINKVLAHQFHQ